MLHLLDSVRHFTVKRLSIERGQFKQIRHSSINDYIQDKNVTVPRITRHAISTSLGIVCGAVPLCLCRFACAGIDAITTSHTNKASLTTYHHTPRAMNMEAPTIRTPASIATPGEVPVEDLDLKGQEDIVRKFAAALGKPKQGSLPKETIAFLLSKSLTNQDVVLKVPSFDIQVSEESGAGNPLPGVGETSSTAEALPPPPPPGTKPSMSASVLTTATQEAADLEQNAARSIGSETSWTKSTILYARDAILTNIAESFNRFTDSRLRSWTLLLLRHSLSTGDESSRSRLLGILSASLHVSATFTNFKVLPMPPTASSRTAPNTVILPLLFDATLDISMKDKMESVTLRTPGTISSKFLIV